MYATACGVPKAAFTAVKFVLAKPMQDSAKQTHPWILAVITNRAALSGVGILHDTPA